MALDAGGDAGPDAGRDAGVDAGPDAGEDAGEDAGPDAGLDAGEDAGPDAGPDAGEDAGFDAGMTATPDAGYGLCGAGSELTSSTSYPDPRYIQLAASADLNGDGMLDLIEFYRDLVDPNYFDIRFGLADGGLGQPEKYSFSGMSSVAVGDLNGDGVPDLVVSNEQGTLVAYINDGGGGLAAGRTASLSSFPNGMAIGDLNGDGRGDIVVGNNNDQLEILLGNSDGGFSAPFTVPIAQATGLESLAVGDLNGDGLADIVADSPLGAQLIVLLSQGDGGFESALYQPSVPGQILFLPNGTSTPDLVVGLGGDGSLAVTNGFAVLHNNGDGTFGAAKTYPILGGGQLAIGDFNGDCVLDVATVASNLRGCQAGWGTSVAYGDGDGGFGNVQFVPAPGDGPDGIEPLGPVDHPDLIATGDFCDGGLTVNGSMNPKP